MDPEIAVEFGQDAILTCLTLTAPILIVGIVVAIILGILQSMTHIQDQTVSFVPKIVLIGITFVLCLPWCTERITEYSREMFEVPKFIAFDNRSFPQPETLRTNNLASSDDDVVATNASDSR